LTQNYKLVEGRRAAGAPAPGENGERPSGAPSFPAAARTRARPWLLFFEKKCVLQLFLL